MARHRKGNDMKAYHFIYLPTGRKETDREGNPITVQASTERGAKSAITRSGRYFDWNLVTPVEVT
mgnify:CR=1 FL=1